jgi:hypothetical protein
MYGSSTIHNVRYRRSIREKYKSYDFYKNPAQKWVIPDQFSKRWLCWAWSILRYKKFTRRFGNWLHFRLSIPYCMLTNTPTGSTSLAYKVSTVRTSNSFPAAATSIEEVGRKRSHWLHIQLQGHGNTANAPHAVHIKHTSIKYATQLHYNKLVLRYL